MDKKENITKLIEQLSKLTIIRHLEISEGLTDNQCCRITAVK